MSRKRARREHYPAPYAIVDLWERHGAHGAAALRAEVESIGRLLVTPTCRNLVHVFELRERLRNLAPKDSRVRHVHVVGAGTMGGDIAAWCALRGLEVTLQDRAQQYVEPALARARELFAKRLRAPGEAEAAGETSAASTWGPPRSARPISSSKPSSRRRRQSAAVRRPRAAPAADRADRYQHVEYPVGDSARARCSAPIVSSGCISSIPSRACRSSK